MANLISKDALWQATADLPWEDVSIRKPPHDEVIGVMRLRGLTGEEVNEWQDRAVHVKGRTRKQSRHAMAMLIVASAINEDGSQYFEPRETMKVSQMPGYALNQLTDVALKLSGLGDDEDARELVEDFGDDPSDGSTSG
ncbi:hypothetical protein [Spongiactinospora sp. TRM90649]|uniref:hypothetical protein n=1 Tax=Spongiactinospora sp. TRM90649 TaxID=3031114 RepID=UPI0023F7E2C1|nr:hypothetical protein [Spongiactinospora sp. TRM90649]MDF5755824.1 hypothetical protein [Spongiactinospora sp. TRM90649]